MGSKDCCSDCSKVLCIHFKANDKKKGFYKELATDLKLWKGIMALTCISVVLLVIYFARVPAIKIVVSNGDAASMERDIDSAIGSIANFYQSIVTVLLGAVTLLSVLWFMFVYRTSKQQVSDVVHSEINSDSLKLRLKSNCRKAAKSLLASEQVFDDVIKLNEKIGIIEEKISSLATLLEQYEELSNNGAGIIVENSEENKNREE